MSPRVLSNARSPILGISPAGQIAAASAAGLCLTAHGESPGDLNVYAARRGNYEVMVRSLFDNRTVRNLLGDGIPPGMTIHAPRGDTMPVRQAADRYAAEGSATVVVAGECYGSGSSRDWAGKGSRFLACGPFSPSVSNASTAATWSVWACFLWSSANCRPTALDLRPGGIIEVMAPSDALSRGCGIPVRILRSTGDVDEFTAVAAVETATEIETLRAGGIIPRLVASVLEYQEEPAGSTPP